MMALSLAMLFPETGDPVTQVSGLALDSRQVVPGDLFIALAGSERDGHDFAAQAVKRGAVAIACERHLPGMSVPVISEPNLRTMVGELAARFYGEPALSLRVLAVTGTNGKTSVAWYIASLLNALGESAVCHGTVGWGQPPRLVATSLTTPDAITLQARFNSLRLAGVRWVALEASSHALDQHRIEASNPEVAIFTNLGRDHLDYHAHMDAYLEAKMRLFRMPSVKLAVINADDPVAGAIEAAVPGDVQIWRIGKSRQADVRYALQEVCTGMQLNVRSPWGGFEAPVSMIGETGPINLLTAMVSLAALGFDLRTMIEQIPQLPPVPGRMQVFAARVPVVVDYAHTPDALRHALTSLRQRFSEGVICVFGCGGDRDSGKRALMASVVDSLATDAWVTDDNPREESASDIRSEICRGFTRLTPQNVANRSHAARQALASARAGQVLLLAGKGHEAGMIRKGRVTPCSDLDLAHSLAECQAC